MEIVSNTLAIIELCYLKSTRDLITKTTRNIFGLWTQKFTEVKVVKVGHIEKTDIVKDR